MTNLPHAPLVYTVGIVHFPAVPEIQRFVPAFHDAVRATYPFNDFVNVPQVSVTMSPDGLRMNQHVASIWQFAAPDRSWAFFLSPQLFGLHTTAYVDHQDFVDKFRHGLSCFLGIDGIGIAYLDSVGIRYVDLVVPGANERLSHYLKDSVLPSEFDELPTLKLEEGVYVSRYTTDEGELRFQVLRNPPTVLPPELESPLTQQNGWKIARPDGEFAVVDIDYGSRFAPPARMDVEFVCDRVLVLRALSKSVFENIGTELAMGVWRGEN